MLLGHHYRTDWDYTPDLLDAAAGAAEAAGARRSRSTTAPSRRDRSPPCAPPWPTTSTPARALAAVDGWAERTLAGEWDDAAAPGLVARTVDAVLGVRL